MLTRYTDFRLINQTAFQPIDVWSNIHHPGIVHVHEAFTTRAFNDNCKYDDTIIIDLSHMHLNTSLECSHVLPALVVAYTYHPNAQTLYDMHFKNRNQQQQQYGSTSRFQPAQVQTLIPERTIWSYIVQIASAVKKVHDLGQAVRMIDISKILVTSQNRCVHISFRGLSCSSFIPVLYIFRRIDLSLQCPHRFLRHHRHPQEGHTLTE